MASLCFNIDKCKCLHFGYNYPENTYYFNDGTNTAVIETCKEEKDLGVTFDSALKFDEHINAIVSKANKIIGLIKRNFKFFTKDTFLKLYKALVRPH